MVTDVNTLFRKQAQVQSCASSMSGFSNIEEHGARLHLFDLVEHAKSSVLDTVLETDRRTPLRIALAKLQILGTVLIVEGKETKLPSNFSLNAESADLYSEPLNKSLLLKDKSP